MTLTPQIRLTRSLQERGRRAVRTKDDAEETIRRLEYDLSNIHFEEMDSEEAVRNLEMAIDAFSDGRYNDSLKFAIAGRDSLDLEAQLVMGNRFIELRKMVDLGFTYPPQEILDAIRQGELAMSTDISESALAAESLREDVKAFILENRPILRRIIEENVREEDRSPSLLKSMDDLDGTEGDLDEVISALNRTLHELDLTFDGLTSKTMDEQNMVEKAVRDIGPIAGMWDQANASKRRGDYRQAFDTQYRIYEELDNLLRQGINDAFDFISYRQKILHKHDIDDETVNALIEDMRHIKDEDPHRALEIYLKLDGIVASYEGDIVSRMIESMSEMIMVGKRVGHDLGPVIVGLDEARQILADGDLDGSLEKIKEVEEILRDILPGFIDMRESFQNLEFLTKELDQYDLDYTEVEKRSEWGREMALRGNFEGAHEMIQEGISILGGQAKEILADKILNCQIGLLSGFRMEAEMEEEAERLEKIFIDIANNKYNDKLDDIDELSDDINDRLKARAEEVLDDLVGVIDSHSNHIDVRPHRELLEQARGQFQKGEYEECYVTVWTAGKKVSGQLIDTVERSKRKIKELITNAEYVNVDVAPLRREMYGLARVGRQVMIEDATNAKDLEQRLMKRISEELSERVENLHIEIGKNAVGGIRLDKQLEKLKQARKALAGGDLRRGFELSREAKTEYEMARILHDEVYNSMVSIERIVETDEDVQTLEKALSLFHDGSYREADITVKKLMRKIVDRGSQAFAAEIMRISERIQDAAEELGLNVTSLKESKPQAEFFIENEDYRLASSLMEKAVSAGRSEIVSEFKEMVPRLRSVVEGTQFRGRDEEAVMEMLARAESLASGAEPERALDILTALKREAAARRTLIKGSEERLRRNRILVRDADRTGFDVTLQLSVQDDAQDLFRQGEFCLSRGLSERAVGQISETIRFIIQSHVDDVKAAGLSGPDLERDLESLNTMHRLVGKRRFRAAADIPGEVRSVVERTDLKMSKVKEAVSELKNLGTELVSEGMSRIRVDTALKQVEEWTARGTFISAYVLAKSHLINIEASLDTYRRYRPRIELFRQMVDDSPREWRMSEFKESLDKAILMISKGDSEDGLRRILEIEDEALRRLDTLRADARDRLTGLTIFLAKRESPEADVEMSSVMGGAVIPAMLNDKWAEIQRMYAKMEVDEQMDVMRENCELCRCTDCPSYNICARDKGERVFCIISGSGCISDLKGCICGDCEVAQRMGMTTSRYCAEGTEAARRGLVTMADCKSVQKGQPHVERYVPIVIPVIESDHELISTLHTLENRARDILKPLEDRIHIISVDPTKTSSETGATVIDGLMERYRRQCDDGDFDEAVWTLNLASHAQGLDEEDAEDLITTLDDCRSQLLQAEDEGIIIGDYLQRFWTLYGAREVKADCRHALWLLKKARKEQTPDLDVSFEKGYLTVRNNRPVIAMDIRLDGRPLAERLGMNESVRYPAAVGRGVALVSFRPLLSGSVRTKRLVI